MKKIIVIILFILSTNISFAEVKDNIFNKQLQKIENETQACLDNSDGGGLEMANCYYNATAKYNKVIKSEIKKLKTTLPKEQVEKLIASQNTWENFVKQEFSLLDEAINYSPPYDATLTYHMIQSNTYNSRARSLENFYAIYLFLKDEKIIE